MSVTHRHLMRRSHQSGIALIEILVAMFVLAIGLLGMAGLQYVSVKNSNSSFLRYQASLLATDMADRMRSNRQYAISGGYNSISVNGSEANVTCSSTCTPAEIKSTDAYLWGQQIKGLPSGQGAVTLSGSNYTITVSWVEQQTGSTMGQVGATTDTRSFSLLFRP